MDTARKLQQIIREFQLPGSFYSCEEIPSGTVSRSYKVKYIIDNGPGTTALKPYLLQCFATKVFRNPDELAGNIDRVNRHIRQKGFPGPDFCRTADGRTYVSDDGCFWRMCSCLPAVTCDRSSDAAVVRKAGEAIGKFELALSDFDISQLAETIPDFHDTRKHYEKLMADANADPCGRAREARRELAYLFSVMDDACRLTDLYNAGFLPLRATHNNTKISKVLFDRQTKDVMTVTGLETVMPGLVGHDFGDAIRYAANFAVEDAEDTDRTGVDLNVFWAFSDGFLSKTAGSLTGLEANTLASSCFAMTCELAVRFLDDYLIGDRYFITEKERHNLIRTRSQIALAKDMQKKLSAMDAIVLSCIQQYR